jgi:hypothetical protein
VLLWRLLKRKPQRIKSVDEVAASIVARCSMWG